MKQNTRHALFVAIVAVLVGIFWKPLWILSNLSLERDEYSHIILIPLTSLLLIYWRRRQVFAKPASTCSVALVPLFAGLALYGVARHFGVTSVPDVGLSLSLSVVGFVVACAGAFLFIYGWPAFRPALFSLGFLFFVVPAPGVLLEKIVYYLQQGSAEVAALMLSGLGVPFFRNGFIFQLPGISIEVAKECSGIRSSIALFITTLLAAQFFLRSNWRKLAICLLIFPVAIVKNGLRITTLSILSVYVSRDFLFGRLHRSGGFVFFFIGLAVLWAALRFLQSGDGPAGPKGEMPGRIGEPVSNAGI
jgi:exosortase